MVILSPPLWKSVLGWAIGWTVMLIAAGVSQYVHGHGGLHFLTSLIVVVGGTAGMTIGGYLACMFRPAGESRRPVREALAWGVAFLASSLVYFSVWEETFSVNSHLVDPPFQLLLLFGALGGFFVTAARLGRDALNNKMRVVLATFVWAVGVYGGGIATGLGVYLLPAVCAAIFWPISPQAGAVFGGVLAGLVGGGAAAIVGMSLAPRRE